MLEQGADPSTAPSLWIVVPILTTLSITLLRQTHGLHGHFESGAGGVEALTMLMFFLCAQLVFGLLGWVVLSRYGYFSRFVTGTENPPVPMHWSARGGTHGHGALLYQCRAGWVRCP